jgi:hypothetical protein
MTVFSRWSLRKRGIQPTEEQTPQSALTPNERGTVTPDENSGEKQDDSLIDRGPMADSEATPPSETVEELPDPESLPPGSDLTAYLAHGVSREVRRRAMKRMFAADHYHHRDGLNDYDEDYRQLKNLSQEVAGRLREWTRQPADQVEDTQREPEQAERNINQPAETAEAQRDDDTSPPNYQAKTADSVEASVASEPIPGHDGQGTHEDAQAKGRQENGTNEAKPPFPEKGRT